MWQYANEGQGKKWHHTHVQSLSRLFSIQKEAPAKKLTNQIMPRDHAALLELFWYLRTGNTDTQMCRSEHLGCFHICAFSLETGTPKAFQFTRLHVGKAVRYREGGAFTEMVGHIWNSSWLYTTCYWKEIRMFKMAGRNLAADISHQISSCHFKLFYLLSLSHSTKTWRVPRISCQKSRWREETTS